MQALAEVEGQLEDALVSHENDDVASGVNYCGADFAVSQVAFDIGANLRVERVVDIFGDAVPDVAAAQSHDSLPKVRRFGSALVASRSFGTSFF